jgi:hypothetical protein
MKKIMMIAGIVGALAMSSMAAMAESEPLVEIDVMLDVGDGFDVLAAMPEFTPSIDVLPADAHIARNDARQRESHAAPSGAFMLAQSSVLPDDALSGGDGRFI